MMALRLSSEQMEGEYAIFKGGSREVDFEAGTKEYNLEHTRSKLSNKTPK